MKSYKCKIIAICLCLIPTLIACSTDDFDISQSHVCGHTTKDGTPCKRVVADGHRYCWQHR